LAYSRTIDQYRKSSIGAASPLQLVVMLYDGALRFMEAGKHAMASGDTYAQNDNLTKAERIVTELLSTLDMTQGGQVAENLFSLYTYVYDSLVEANIEDKPEKIDECVQIFSDLRESWVELERKLREGAMGDGRAA